MKEQRIVPTDLSQKGNLLQALGPGILMAAAAVGGSHLVASTKAGAQFGWSLLIVMLLVNLFKYPFFMYGARYTAATGETILHGYRRLGKGYLLAFFLLNLVNAVFNIAGVSLISGSLALNLGMPGHWEPKVLSLVISSGCAAIIIFGHYHLLDKVTKVIMLLLTVCTLFAVMMALSKGSQMVEGFEADSPWALASVGFLVQFMGWMPAPIDVGAWPSLWMMSREKETGYRASMKHAMIDFHIGYLGTTVLAMFFLALGALVMFGTGESFSPKGGVFAGEFITLYARSIGDWARPVVAVAAFITMFSTTLTCVDGYPRSLGVSMALFRHQEGKWQQFHIFWILLCLVAAMTVNFCFVTNLGQMLFLAMVVSFVTSPVFAWINFAAMRAEWVPEIYRPGRVLTALSWAGLVFLTACSLGFVYWWLKLK
ncbi:Nramp family divalent metal transporter [Kiritimatiellaeota bacterium B1221]|nr:Nramp family divalent metal transporter [Kiritimatiellaeota bacterium B1221]